MVDSGLIERAGALRYLLHPVIADHAGLCQNPVTVDGLLARLMTYVTDFLEAHACADHILALESSLILAALDVARACGKQAELAHAIQLCALFLWRIALPLTSALRQGARKQEAPGTSHLMQAVIALADHLRDAQERGECVLPSLYGGVTAYLPRCALSRQQGSCEALPPHIEHTDVCPE